jgi:hypothetical protein
VRGEIVSNDRSENDIPSPVERRLTGGHRRRRKPPGTAELVHGDWESFRPTDRGLAISTKRESP